VNQSATIRRASRGNGCPASRCRLRWDGIRIGADWGVGDRHSGREAIPCSTL
jgi:hypothetical protein